MARNRSVFLAAIFFLLASCAAKKEAAIPTPVEPQAQVVIIQLQLAEGQEKGQARLKIRIQEKELAAIDPEEIYLEDETTKTKYPVVRLQRIGVLATFGVPGEEGTRYIMFWNHDGGLKIGKLVTANIGKHRRSMLVR